MQQSAISPQDKAQLKRTWRKDLKGEVKLKLFTQKPSPLTIPGRECPYCPQTEQLMEELAELSPKLHLEIFDYYAQPEVAQEYDVKRVPAIVISADDSPRVKFYGMPMGLELATIIEGIKTISRGVSPLPWTPGKSCAGSTAKCTSRYSLPPTVATVRRWPGWPTPWPWKSR